MNIKSAFHWNAGGWFGSQLGSTLWILILAFMVAGINLQIASLIFVCFLIPNIVGYWLWKAR